MRDYPETPETIARAKAHQQQERARIFTASGVRITDAGAVYTQACPRCAFVASATADGLAVRALAAHLISPAHMSQAKEGTT